jgi:crotonobetainyl-CoA:carnitine CoA-transferase CaiB-like acyl-CoA transferase
MGKSNKLPLTGIKVLEIAAYISGPYAGSLLAALGAEVVKIEPPDGEAFRIGRNEASPYFRQYNSGKKSVALDLKSEQGVSVVKSLLPRYDVLIENMRPGKLNALGLGAEVCRAINPQLIYASVSGFGSGGPLRDRPAYDSIGQSFGGVYTVMNDNDDVRLTGTCIADLISGVSTTAGILAALVGRDRGSGGTQIETSVLESMSLLTVDALTQAFDADLDPVRETRHPQAQNFCLKTASGNFISMHLSSSERFWKSLARAVGREDLLKDARYNLYAERTKPENFAFIKKVMEEEFIKRPRDEWERRLTDADVPFAPALTMREVISHPQTEWLGLFNRQSPDFALVQPPWRFDGTRAARDGRAPRIGEHTLEVLREVRSSEELESLLKGKAISPASDDAKSR